MNEIITKIKTINIEELYNEIANSNLTEEELVQKLSTNPCLLNSFLHFYSFINGSEELTSNISNAIEIIEYNRFLEFKEAVKNNTYGEFLSQIDWLSKCFLYDQITYEDGHPEFYKYTSEITNLMRKDERNEGHFELIQEYKKQQIIMNNLLYPTKQTRASKK